MKNLTTTINTASLAAIYADMSANNIAEFISAAFPADAEWSTPKVYRNIGWFGYIGRSVTNIGNKLVSIMYRDNGIFLDIVGDTFRPDTVYFKESKTDGKIGYYLDVDGSCDTNVIDKSKLDDIVKATRRMIWSTWYSNESGRLVQADKFIVRHRKSDNKLHFYDKNGNWLRTSSQVVSVERHANGYVKYVTESGRVYNLTTI